jgi:hypothetical protein
MSLFNFPTTVLVAAAAALLPSFSVCAPAGQMSSFKRAKDANFDLGSEKIRGVNLGKGEAEKDTSNVEYMLTHT